MFDLSLPPELATRFRVTQALGRGSFGRVLEVTEGDNPARALKLVALQDDGARERRELEASRRVEHPNVLRCFDSGVTDQTAWMLLELAEGSLSDLLAADQIEAAWETLLDAAEGVSAIHVAGLVHRDLKPDNILLIAGKGVVADLGLAKGADLKTLTQEGWVLGTPAFMAPEQARGDRPSPAADAFALGVMAYQILEGRLPYSESEPARLLPLVAQAKLAPWHHARERLSPQAFVTLASALAADPEERPRDLLGWARTLRAERLRDSGKTFVAATRRIENPLPAAPLPTALPPSSPAPQVDGSQRPMALFMAVGALLFGVSFLGPGSIVLPPPTVVSIAAEEPKEDLQGLKPGIALRIDGELEVAQKWRRKSPSVVVKNPTPEQLRELRPFLDPNPNQWAAVVRDLPNLSEFYEWLGSGGRCELLPEEERRAMQEIDQAFFEVDLPRPFHPWAYLEPLPESHLVTELAPELTEQGLDKRKRASGWLAVAAQAASSLLREIRRLNLEAYAAVSGESIERLSGTYPFPTKTYLSGDFIGEWKANAEDPDGLIRHTERLLRIRSKRLPMTLWMRPGAEFYRSTVYAIARSLREEPETSGVAMKILDVIIHPARNLGDNPTASLPPSALLGPVVHSPEGLFFQGVMNSRFFDSRNHIVAPGGETATTAARWLRKALDHPKSQTSLDPAVRQQVIHEFFLALQKGPHAQLWKSYHEYSDQLSRVGALVQAHVSFWTLDAWIADPSLGSDADAAAVAEQLRRAFPKTPKGFYPQYGRALVKYDSMAESRRGR